jgi:predicted ATPase
VRFGQDIQVSITSFRAMALWVLGYPDAALADADQAVAYAREIGQAATLMYAQDHASFAQILCGRYATANALIEEAVGLADEKGTPFWSALGISQRGCIFALTGRPADAVQMLTSGIAAWRSTKATIWVPWWLSHLAQAYAALGQFDEAWRSIGDAMTAVETAREKWCEAEVHRVAGEIALKAPGSDAAKAPKWFETALALAREQQAKSWELRAATSMARLCRDQGKPGQARDLLAPIYGWFSECLDTLDLKQAKALLDELASGGQPRSARPLL